MRKIIDGKIYDTATAVKILQIPCDFSSTDFNWEDTRLYRTTKGAFFLSGEGGPLSRWAGRSGLHGWTSGNGLRLCAPDEARNLVETHGTPTLYEATFGPCEEG